MNFIPEYQIKFSNHFPLDETDWCHVSGIKDFLLPWQTGSTPITEFKAVYNTKWLSLNFDLTSPTIHVFKALNDKIEVAFSDRVEIFFKTDENLRNYYCLEIDPMGRVLDYQAFFYRKFNYSWSWPANHFWVDTKLTSMGYKVNARISLESLSALDILKDGTIKAGIFRADCQEPATSIEKEPEMKWTSWINPKTKNPDFHVPNAFGVLKLV
jgi:hypothetical protein